MSTIHIKNIYKEGELNKDSTCKEYLHVAHERAVRNEKQLLLHVVYIIFCSCINCEAHMAMSILQIRVDDNLKNEVSDLFERLGMDIPTAVRIFFKRAIIERGLPFNVNEIPSTTKQDNSRLMQALYALNDEAHKNGTAGMSEEEIEAEIKAARAERKKKHGVRSR